MICSLNKVVMQPHTKVDEEAGVVSEFYGIDKSQLLSKRKIIATAVSLHNKAVYTAISVACGWAGAVMSLCKPRNSEICDQKLDDTDQRMDQLTNGPTSRLIESRSSD